MGQTFFSKLDAEEKKSRLYQLATLGSSVTIWKKGSKDKVTSKVIQFDKDNSQISLKMVQLNFSPGEELLASFEIRGVSFFSQVKCSVHPEKINLDFSRDLFKSERRATYRLFTSHLFNIWASLDLGVEYKGGNVIEFNSKSRQTDIFKNFMKLADGVEDNQSLSQVKLKLQDISVTGMSLTISSLELPFFEKDKIFHNVNLHFPDEVIVIPELKIVYLVEFLSPDKKMKMFKVGCHFLNLPSTVDHTIGKKINALLRETDANKDFENFLK
jgi:hypothetical protein